MTHAYSLLPVPAAESAAAELEQAAVNPEQLESRYGAAHPQLWLFWPVLLLGLGLQPADTDLVIFEVKRVDILAFSNRLARYRVHDKICCICLQVSLSSSFGLCCQQVSYYSLHTQTD